MTKLVDENIRNQQSLAIVSELYGDPWATGCLDRLREAGYRIRLLLINCEETVMATRAKHRNLNAEALIERQRAVIDEAALQAAKGARVELLHSRKPPLAHAHPAGRRDPVPEQADDPAGRGLEPEPQRHRAAHPRREARRGNHRAPQDEAARLDPRISMELTLRLSFGYWLGRASRTPPDVEGARAGGPAACPGAVLRNYCGT